MPSLIPPRLAAAAGGLLASTALPLGAQASPAPPAPPTAFVTGVVVDHEDRVVHGASVAVHRMRVGTTTDAEGRYLLRVPAGDSVRLTAVRIAFERADTAFVAQPGDTIVWNVSLRLNAQAVRQLEARRRDVAGGRIDSIAAGLVTIDSSRSFTFERFGIDLLRAEVARTGGRRTHVLSPLSVGEALTLAWGGARDSTAAAIGRVLRAGPLDATAVATRTQGFRRSLAGRTDATLGVANALWAPPSETLSSRYVEWSRRLLDATVRTVPLHEAAGVQALNAWADSATRGRIPVVRDEPFDHDVRVVITNAVYFKGLWLEPFDAEDTRPRPFTTGDGGRLDVPMMERAASLAHRRGPSYQVVRLPYRAGLTAMYVVLPDPGVSPLTVLDSIAAIGWPVPDERTDRKDVHLLLPRVRIEQTTDLIAPLTAMGLGIAFDRAGADFNDLFARPREATFVSEATQGVFIEIDEKGTEAAAVTLMGVTTTSVKPPPIPFVVDRPYLIAIRDERTGILLFVGYIQNPRS